MEKVLIFKFPILLLPLLLITGPFLSDLALTLSSLFFVILLVLNRKYEYLMNKYFLFFIFFWIYISINSLFSESFISIKSSLSYLRFGIFLILFLYIFEKEKKFLKNMKNLILISLIILFIDSLIQYYAGQNVLGYPKDGRISSFFGDEKILGSYIVKLVPIFIALYYFDKNEIKLDIYIFSILIGALVLILLSSERSALGLFLLYLFLLSIIFYKDFKRLIIYGSIILIFFTTIIFTSESIYNRYIVVLFDQFKVSKTDNVKHSKKFYYFTEGHDALFITAFNMFKEKPIIGHGTKNFRIKCGDRKFIQSIERNLQYYQNLDRNLLNCNTHPHNFYVQILAENGIIGFLFISVAFIFFVFLFIKNIFFSRNKKMLNFIISSNIVILWPIVPHGDFFNNWLSIIIFLNFSIFICLDKYYSMKKV